MNYIKVIEDAAGAVVMPKGFKTGATYCGLKTNKDSLDIGIIFSEFPSIAAAVFTNNQVSAAPIKFCKEIIMDGNVRAVVVNSGNANACTGKQGYKDTETMAELTAEHLNIDAQEILVASTGIIGQPLSMDNVRSGIVSVVQDLNCEISSGSDIAKAILTTDTFVKETAVKVDTKDISFTIGGIAKGSGMISPGMATMLSFITTDANISHENLKSCLKRSVDKSFNRITVDGHMSTNDMVAVLSNGAGQNNRLISSNEDISLFQEALNSVTIALAKLIVKDGEGATKFIQVEVTNAKSQDDAEKIAKAIANSPLVKTAINGEDYNWGRIVSAAGYSGAELDENRLNLYINGILIFNHGTPVPELAEENVDFHQKLQEEMRKKEIVLSIELGLGNENTIMWTCDFSHEYITINAEYHT